MVGSVPPLLPIPTRSPEVSTGQVTVRCGGAPWYAARSRPSSAAAGTGAGDLPPDQVADLAEHAWQPERAQREVAGGPAELPHHPLRPGVAERAGQQPVGPVRERAAGGP